MQIIDRLLPQGGAERMQILFAEGAPEADLDLSLVTMQPSDAEMLRSVEESGAEVRPLSGERTLSLQRVRKLAAIVRHTRPDVIHTHLRRSTIVGALVGKLTGVPVVTSLHNVPQGQGARPAIQRLEAWALRYGVSAVIAVGWQTAEAQRLRTGDRSLDVIPNAVAPLPEASPAETRALRAEFDVQDDAPLLLAVGRLHVQKAFPDLLRAFAAISDRFPTARLVIAGEGAERARIEETISELDLLGKVFVPGPRRDVPTLLAASDLFVSSSLWEGLPISLLEAMSAGLPIVATGVGDVPQVLDASCGRLVEAGQPDELATELAALLANRDLARKLGEAAADRVRRDFSLESWMQRQRGVYERVIGRGARRGSRAALGETKPAGLTGSLE